MKYSFIVLETKVINDIIHVYGGLVPSDRFQDSHDKKSMALFQWYKLSEVKQ